MKYFLAEYVPHTTFHIPKKRARTISMKHSEEYWLTVTGEASFLTGFAAVLLLDVMFYTARVGVRFSKSVANQLHKSRRALKKLGVPTCTVCEHMSGDGLVLYSSYFSRSM